MSFKYIDDRQHHAAWLRSHHWTARVVIVLGEIAIAYLAFVFGLLFGAGFGDRALRPRATRVL